jgi:hypothetical protein
MLSDLRVSSKPSCNARYGMRQPELVWLEVFGFKMVMIYCSDMECTKDTRCIADMLVGELADYGVVHLLTVLMLSMLAIGSCRFQADPARLACLGIRQQEQLGVAVSLSTTDRLQTRSRAACCTTVRICTSVARAMFNYARRRDGDEGGSPRGLDAECKFTLRVIVIVCSKRRPYEAKIPAYRNVIHVIPD